MDHHPIHAQADQILRKHFGERRCDGFYKAVLSDQRQISVDSVADGGKHASLGNYEIARYASGLREADPLFDPTRRARFAIVIDNAFSPDAAKLGRVAARKDQSVFDGDGFLIVIAVEGPSLKLAARELAFVHQPVKWMLMVITFFADGAQLFFERLRREHGHIVISIPS